MNETTRIKTKTTWEIVFALLFFNVYISPIKPNMINPAVDKVVNIVLLVDRKNEVSTKKGDKMLFITGSDEINQGDVVLFPKTYEKYPNIKVGDVLGINAKVEKRFDKYQLVVNTIKHLS